MPTPTRQNFFFFYWQKLRRKYLFFIWNFILKFEVSTISPHTLCYAPGQSLPRRNTEITPCWLKWWYRIGDDKKFCRLLVKLDYRGCCVVCDNVLVSVGHSVVIRLSIYQLLHNHVFAVVRNYTISSLSDTCRPGVHTGARPNNIKTLQYNSPTVKKLIGFWDCQTCWFNSMLIFVE